MTKLTAFRFKNSNVVAVTTHPDKSKLPLGTVANGLDYQLTDWNFLSEISDTDLPDMISNSRTVQHSIDTCGYGYLEPKMLKSHPFYAAHKIELPYGA